MSSVMKKMFCGYCILPSTVLGRASINFWIPGCGGDRSFIDLVVNITQNGHIPELDHSSSFYP